MCHDYSLCREVNDMKRQRWLKLDNAAKIYPGSRSRTWSNVYRLSVDLNEPIDRECLSRALSRTAKRFPYIAARLGSGLFWYYLEPAELPLPIQKEASAPCTCLSREETRRCAMRVRVYGNRLALEFFHVLTDANGGLVFLKTLLAAYLEERYGVIVPPTDGVYDLSKMSTRGEREDSFVRYKGKVARPRKDPAAWRIPGRRYPDRPLSLIRGEMDIADLKAAAKAYNISITTYLVAALMWSMIEIQSRSQPYRHLRKPIRILVPVNLRAFFETTTLRNFVLFITPSIDTKLGEYTFDEIVKLVHHQMGLELTTKQLQTRITTNVRTEENPILRVLPLFIKNLGMQISYRLVGERANTMTISNLGNVTFPKEMTPYIEGVDFTLGRQAMLPYSSSAVGYNGKFRMAFTRSVDDPVVEQVFFPFLRKQGIRVKITTN